MSPEEIGALIREGRKVANLNQTELARMMRQQGYMWTQPTVATLEKGDRNLLYAEAVALRNIIGFDAGVPASVEAKSAIILNRIRALMEGTA